MGLLDIIDYGTDIVNFGTGVYKGYMNAAGVEVDPSVIGYTFLATVAVSGAVKMGKVIDHNHDPAKSLSSKISARICNKKYEAPNPVAEGAKRVFGYAPIAAFEITAGYALGYLAQKVIN